MAEGNGGDRTEAASARRLQQAREEGNVPISREAVGLSVLAAGSGALIASWAHGGERFTITLQNLVASSGRIEFGTQGTAALWTEIGVPAAVLVVPVLLAAVIAAVAATAMQSGLNIRPQALIPDIARLNPGRGLKRLFGTTNLVEAAKSIVKLAAFAFVVERILAGALSSLSLAGYGQASATANTLIGLITRAVLMLLAVQAVITAIDIVWVRYHRRRGLLMSKQDVRDEHKDTEGNPHVKGRLRQLRRQRARQRMMLAVPRAAVVLTNPTHYAVALSYEQGSRSAPKVIAKGADEVAARIRALAREHRVPVVANPPLARALFTVPLDQEIPREHFQAVAAVIAYVWRLGQRRAPAIQ